MNTSETVIDLTLQAGKPFRPLVDIHVLAGSAVRFRLTGISLPADASVSIIATNADDVPHTVAATRDGSDFVAIIPASAFEHYGVVENGFKVAVADSVTTSTIGYGNLYIDKVDASAQPGEPTEHYLTKDELGELFERIDLADEATQREIRTTLQLILEKLKGLANCAAIVAAGLLAATAEAITPATVWEDVPPTSVVSEVVSQFAPPPGNYEIVSNRAMTALQQHQDISGKADKADTYTKAQVDAAVAAVPRMSTNDVRNIVTNEVSVWSEWTVTPSVVDYDDVYVEWNDIGIEKGWYYIIHGDRYFSGSTDPNASNLSYDYDGTTITASRQRITRNALGLARMSDLPPLTNGLATTSITNGFITDAYISTNNAAFVNAVTNCPVAIAASDAEALAEWGIYGGGGTIGALLAALAAAVAALKKKKMPLYPVGGTGNPVNATYESGVLTVSPFAMAAYTPTASAAFSVAMGALPSDMESGKARDAVLVIDCSSLTEGQEPTVTWDTHFHPRTDAGTDFACVAGAKNVYYISEYAAGEFAVGGWTETAGGNT